MTSAVNQDGSFDINDLAEGLAKRADEDTPKYFECKVWNNFSPLERQRRISQLRNYYLQLEIGLKDEVVPPIFVVQHDEREAKRKAAELRKLLQKTKEEEMKKKEDIPREVKILKNRMGYYYGTVPKQEHDWPGQDYVLRDRTEEPRKGLKYMTSAGFTLKSNYKIGTRNAVVKYQAAAKSDVTEEEHRYPRRNIPRPYYKEDPLPEEEHFSYCCECEGPVLGGCVDHGKPFRLFSTPARSGIRNRALRTLPKGIRVGTSAIENAGLGVFAVFPIPPHTMLGPYEGNLLTESNDDGYCWQLRLGTRGNLSVDAKDESKASWLRYVNCARHDSEQNLLPVQHQGQIFYLTRGWIPPGVELLTWYGKDFMRDLGIDLDAYFKPKPQPTSSACTSVSSALQTVSSACTSASSTPQQPASSTPQPASSACTSASSSSTAVVCKTQMDPKVFAALTASSALLFYKRVGHNALQCVWCPISFSSINFVQRHAHTKHGSEYSKLVVQHQATIVFPPSLTSTTLGACFDQGDITSSLMRLVASTSHDNNSVVARRLVQKQRDDGKKRAYQCDVCGKCYTTKCNLSAHKKVHSEDTMLKCQYCDYVTGIKRNLDRHVLTHTGQRDHVCEVCHKTFSHKHTLVTHVKEVHDKIKSHVCSHCGAKFAQKSTLDNHVTVHTGERPYACSKCDYKATQSGHLTSHMRAHTGQRPYKCSVCDYRATQSGHLTSHMRAHTGKKPYACHLCDYCGVTSGEVTSHMRMHSEEKCFQCPECDFQTSHGTDLNKHMNEH